MAETVFTFTPFCSAVVANVCPYGTALEPTESLGISLGQADQIIRTLNTALSKEGYDLNAQHPKWCWAINFVCNQMYNRKRSCTLILQYRCLLYESRLLSVFGNRHIEVEIFQRY